MRYQYYVGTELKFVLTIEAEGFDMNRDEFDVTIIGSDGKEYQCTEDDVKNVDGVWYLLLDTNNFANGLLRMVVSAYVPDSIFPDGTRKEVTIVNLCTICSYK